ncbi:hypothetical protein DLH72_05255, partial [Candidatus Gracilibacteria bacterium]
MKKNFLNPKEIFQKLGFPEYVFNSRIPENSLFRWSKNKQFGKIEQKRGREKQEEIDFDNMTLEQENEYL